MPLPANGTCCPQVASQHFWSECEITKEHISISARQCRLSGSEGVEGDELRGRQGCGEHPFLDLDDLSKEKPDYSRTYRNIVK